MYLSTSNRSNKCTETVVLGGVKLKKFNGENWSYVTHLKSSAPIPISRFFDSV